MSTSFTFFVSAKGSTPPCGWEHQVTSLLKPGINPTFRVTGFQVRIFKLKMEKIPFLAFKSLE
jgi:hypothetical protein